jgi:cytochrome c553
LRWAVRITPSRKISSGDLALQPILDGVEKGQLAALDQSVAAKDVKQFETAYRGMMEACVACHTASEKPYLKLHVPKAPAEPMIDFDAK